MSDKRGNAQQPVGASRPPRLDVPALHVPDRRWASPPFALAELLTGKPFDPAAGPWQLGELFAVRGQLLYAPDARRPTLLDLLTSPRFKARAYENADAVLNAAIRDWSPDDRAQRARLQKMVDKIRAAVAADRLELVLSLMLPPEADLGGAPGAEEAEPGTGLQYIDYEDPSIGGRFLVGAARFDDPRQFCWSDCYLITALIAMCWVEPEAMAQRLRKSLRDVDLGSKRWHAWTPLDLVAGQRAAEVQADGELPFSSQRDTLFANSTQAREYWPAIMEKIYLLAITAPPIDRGSGKGPTRKRYRAINFGWPHVACARLFGGTIGEARTPRANLAAILAAGIDPISQRKLLDAARASSGGATGKTLVPVCAWTLSPTAEDAAERQRYQSLRQRYEENFISHTHAYAVLGRMLNDGVGHIVLREPRCDPMPAPLPEAWVQSGSWKLPRGTQPVAEVELNQNGIFALREDVFNELFGGIGWVVLPENG